MADTSRNADPDVPVPPGLNGAATTMRQLRESVLAGV